MKNKKLLGLLIGLVCIALCVALVLTFCQNSKDDPEGENPSETEGQQETDPTEAEPTAPDVTQPEPTEPEETAPEETEPEATEPEATEPEETQPSGGSSTPSVNTGTGGGYDPGTSQPTEPEDATEPEIVVPAPGSEKNAYSEFMQESSGSFTTVKIPAGEKIYYRLKSTGSFLRVEDENAKLTVGETVYQAENGILQMELPADSNQVVAVAFVNETSEEIAFTVDILDVVGSQSNPIAIDSVANIQANLEEGDADGVFYRWIADQDGTLKMALGSVECADDVADAVITVNGESVRLSDHNGQAEIPVNAGDAVLIQVLTSVNADGIHPQAQIQVCGYVAVFVDLEVSQVPDEIESVTVPGKQSVIYRITGTTAKSLRITDSDFSVVCEDVLYSPNEDGVILLDMPKGADAAVFELINQGEDPKTAMLCFDYPLGHKLNPYHLTALGQLMVQIAEEQDGYYYSYTAQNSGEVIFQVWTYPEQDSVKTDIVIVNETSGKTLALWSTGENGEDIENASVAMPVNAGDELTVWVSVTDVFGYSIYTSLEIYGDLYGSDELPIPIMYPGFTACVPAGETLYYEGYNLSDMILSMTGSDVTVAHNGAAYTPNGGQISFSVVAEGRNPARFAITNTGSETAAYEVVFTHPVGHAENPAALVLGVNTLIQEAGAADYYYTFTAPRAGALTFTFDSSAQWVYAVDNVTQGIYGDTQWSDSDPMMPETTVQVEAGDELVIRVNTYDAANMFEAPAGTVEFEAKYVSGPSLIEIGSGAVETVLIPGEYTQYYGSFYGYMLTISEAKDAVVYYNGAAYYADNAGELVVEFPESGSEELFYEVHNSGSTELTLSMAIMSKNKGTKDNPDAMVEGSNVMTQDEDNGADYYYTFTVAKGGQFKLTIDSTTGWIYELTNATQGKSSGIQRSIGGKKTYTLAVKAGDVVILCINTFDRKTGGSIVGTVEFTIDAP